jgi:glycosyltransferase involved in cell wall biosynthesis
MNNGRDLVSVIVPAYNAQRHIEATLDTILRQSYRPIEIIIIDDGSTDSTVQVVNKFNRILKNAAGICIKLLAQPNKGPSAARNKGIAGADGKYIALLDVDDNWHSEKLKKQVDLLELCLDLDIVVTNGRVVRKIGDQQEIFTLYEKENLDRDFFGHEYRVLQPYMKLLKINFIPTSSFLSKKSCFRGDCQFTESRRHAEDWELWLRLAKRHNFGYIPEPCMTKTEDGKGLSANQDKMIISQIQILNIILPECENYYVYGITNKWLKNHLRKTYKWAGYHFFKKRNYKFAFRYLLTSLKYGVELRILGYIGLAIWGTLFSNSLKKRRISEKEVMKEY